MLFFLFRVNTIAVDKELDRAITRRCLLDKAPQGISAEKFVLSQSRVGSGFSCDYLESNSRYTGNFRIKKYSVMELK